ncbi:MAG: hypothetical protein LC768_10680 [Acidobacteria bacterium]|nr:hypothetical protein [Acidobacteriota bacterium]MCA1638779.1 hypothetical protein [Acidobacteriota bacterium]
MEFKTEDFTMDRDTATAKRISNRLDNLYDDLNRCRNPRCNHSNRIREEDFLLTEALKILQDETATRAEQAFAGIVYELVSQW